MKKSFFLRLITVAMMAAMCVTLTACGGDSDDDGTPQVPTGLTGSTEYVDNAMVVFHHHAPRNWPWQF